MKQIGIFATWLTIVAVATVINGWVISKFWAWFIVGTFNQNPLSMAQSIGLSVTVGYLTHQITPAEKGKKFTDTLIESGTIAVLRPLLCLLFGWVVTLWM